MFVQKTKKSGTGLLVYFFFVYVLVTNVSVIKPAYEYDEGWSVMNMFLIIITIAFCLEWRRIIQVFLLCKAYYVANIYYAYGSMPFISWFYLIFEILLVWVIIITLSKIVLSFIELNIKMKHLLKTVRKLLQVFPEAVLIESFAKEENWSILKFINDTAKKEFFNEQKKYDLQSLNLDLRVRKDWDEHDGAFERISGFLRTQMESVREIKQEVSTEIKGRLRFYCCSDWCGLRG